MAIREESMNRYTLTLTLIMAVTLANQAGPAMAQSGDYDVQARRLQRIQPGTAIGNGAPDGWTDLIIKSQPKLASGDIDKLPSIAVPLSNLLFSTMLARTSPHQSASGTRYYLETIAIGLGTKVRQLDTIVSSDSQETLGADFGMIEKIILSQSENELDKFIQVARSSTMIVVDAPGYLLVNKKNRPVFLRYTCLVDVATGKLTGLAWPIVVDNRGKYLKAGRTMVKLRTNMIDECPLHVDSSAFVAGIPTARAFAMARLPAGTPLPVPEPLVSISARRQLTPDMARRMEVELRRVTGLALP